MRQFISKLKNSILEKEEKMSDSDSQWEDISDSKEDINESKEDNFFVSNLRSLTSSNSFFDIIKSFENEYLKHDGRKIIEYDINSIFQQFFNGPNAKYIDPSLKSYFHECLFKYNALNKKLINLFGEEAEKVDMTMGEDDFTNLLNAIMFMGAQQMNIDMKKDYEEQNKTLSASSSDYNASDEDIQITGQNMQLNEDMDY